MKWQKEKPDSEGDWLWVEMWTCNCCVHRSGIAWVQKVDMEKDGYSDKEKEDFLADHEDLGNNFYLHWQGSRPDKYVTIDTVTAWMKLPLPIEHGIDTWDDVYIVESK
tara:strand:+ start:121 stop:444 length:324 start_codon:yes stop_codon:yes gene_type:complete